MERPRVLLPIVKGINCDEETAIAFELAGAIPERVPLNALIERRVYMKDYQILALSGGFSHGDHFGAGVVMADQLTSSLGDDFNEFVDHHKKAVIGICNGDQVLGKTGKFGRISLRPNDNGRFNASIIRLAVNSSPCSFLDKLPTPVEMMVAHAEGKFYALDETLQDIESQKLVALRYVDQNGQPTLSYPDNPNGSLNAIAGITNRAGNVLGLMPHPERSAVFRGPGLTIFEEMVRYAKQS